MAIILCYFAKFGIYRGHLRKSGWVNYPLTDLTDFSPRNVIKYTRRAVLFVLAKLLVFWYQQRLVHNTSATYI